MVTKIINIMILTIFFNLLLVGDSSTDTCFVNSSDILFFENYSQNEIILPEKNPLDVEKKYFTDKVIVNIKTLRQLQGDKITEELFDVLCNLDLINHWNIYKDSDSLNPYSYNYEEFIEKRKQELELFYLGKLKLSKSFDSFLILVTSSLNNDYFITKEVFLINVVNNAVVSITRMCNYACFEGHSNLIFTKRLAKGTFIQTEKEISSDVILPKGMKPEKEKIAIKFTYDEKGMLLYLTK